MKNQKKVERNLDEQSFPDDDFPPLSRSQLAELRRRDREMRDPVRYIVVSELIPRKHYFYYIVEDNCYGMDLDQATLFKKREMAEAVRKELDRGKSKKNRHMVVKITTKNERRKVLRYFR